LAVSRVTINHGNIRTHFQAAPLRGTSRRAGRGEARTLAAKMALAARANTVQFEQRTNALVTSVVPIVRETRGGGVEVGVGTTVEHGKWLEIGTDEHPIRPQVPFRGRGRGGYFLRSNGPNSKGFNPDPLERPRLFVNHPGNPARHWMSDAVRAVFPGARVRVTWPPRNGYPGGQAFR
jgi:hypothetical protein